MTFFILVLVLVYCHRVEWTDNPIFCVSINVIFIKQVNIHAFSGFGRVEMSMVVLSVHEFMELEREAAFVGKYLIL